MHATIIVRIDGAGASRALLEHFTGLNSRRRRVYYTVGWAMRSAVETVITQLSETTWSEAIDSGGEIQHGYQEAHAKVSFG